MILGTIFINATLLVASNMIMQNMQMERAMHAHAMEMEERAVEEQPADKEQLLRQAPALDEVPFGENVPDKEGFVISPHSKQVVDCRGIPSGTLVQDPTFPAREKKYFRVP